MAWYNILILVISVFFAVFIIIKYIINKNAMNSKKYLIYFTLVAFELLSTSIYFSIVYKSADFTNLFTIISGWTGGLFTFIVAIMIFSFTKEKEESSDIMSVKYSIIIGGRVYIIKSVSNFIKDINGDDKIASYGFIDAEKNPEDKILIFVLVSVEKCFVLSNIENATYTTENGVIINRKLVKLNVVSPNPKMNCNFDNILKQHIKVFYSISLPPQNIKKISFSIFGSSVADIRIEIKVDIQYNKEHTHLYPNFKVIKL